MRRIMRKRNGTSGDKFFRDSYPFKIINSRWREQKMKLSKPPSYCRSQIFMPNISLLNPLFCRSLEMYNNLENDLKISKILS